MRAQANDQQGKKEHMSQKLLPDEQRAVVMAALQYGSNKSEIARNFGISRQRIYQLLESAMNDPKGKLREAEREVAFRRRVLELTR
jgi:DNA-directed RNA polymerase specialized sigma subunit